MVDPVGTDHIPSTSAREVISQVLSPLKLMSRTNGKKSRRKFQVERTRPKGRTRLEAERERKSATWNEIPEDNRRHVLLDEETRCEKPVAAQDHIDEICSAWSALLIVGISHVFFWERLIAYGHPDDIRIRVDGRSPPKG